MKSTKRIRIVVIAGFITLVAVTGNPVLGQQYIAEKMLEEQIEKKMLAEQIGKKNMQKKPTQERVASTRNRGVKKMYPNGPQMKPQK